MEDRSVMQQQQQAAEEAARADLAAIQALIAQVLRLRGETATIVSTVPTVLGDPNTGTPDASVRPQARQPHAPVSHKLSRDVILR
ncbi:hypothetical protein Hamer_G002411 [Homarus americanus]|uniref:Uncharacterized protein n=1 Tax=Homarus americanus TaxID=6706 RepID=A0A8J5MYT8_HOMAM|nr:hypothetical protein Hamer_G002411 [Homarus americanus]